jgi:hypothetical protein
LNATRRLAWLLGRLRAGVSPGALGGRPI